MFFSPLNPIQSYYLLSLIYAWTISLLISIPALSSTASLLELFSSLADDDNLLFVEEEEIATASSADSSPLFDPIWISSTTPKTLLETEPPFLPFLTAESSPSSGCPSSSSFLSNNNNARSLRRLRRGLVITTRQSAGGGGGGGESCTIAPPFKSQPGSSSESRSSSQNQNQNLDVGRLGVMDKPSEYFCSEFVGWAFGSIPVCSVDDPEGVPSEVDLDEPDLLWTINLSGYRNFVDCFQITPFNFFLCPDDNAWCCNAFLPDPLEGSQGKGFWCKQARRKVPTSSFLGGP